MSRFVLALIFNVSAIVALLASLYRHDGDLRLTCIGLCLTVLAQLVAPRCKECSS